MKRSTFAAAWLSAFVVASAPDMAHAGVPVDLPEALFLPVGVNVGGAFYGDQPDGFLIGGEVSIAKTGGILWYGGYADGVWDTSSEALRFSTGPELGLGPYGIDGGYLMRIDGEGLRHGFTLRAMMTIGVASLAGRYGHVFGVDKNASFYEMSVLLKIPIVLVGHL